MAAGVLFLDRDGVLNRKAPEGGYVRGPHELVLLDGVGEALARIGSAVPGLRTAIVTNQRGIALGVMRLEDVDRTNERLTSLLAEAGAAIDRIEVCPHEQGVCDCRKPGTGMLERVFAAWPDAAVAASALVGDRASDIIAGHTAGVRTYRVWPPARREHEAALATARGAAPDETASSLVELAERETLAAWLRDRARR